MTAATSTPPLTPAVFHILLALSSGELHGYGIMKQVETDSQGKVTMGPGTLYGSLKRTLDAGLVREGDKRVDPEMDDQRRIYYRITDLGAKALAAELEHKQQTKYNLPGFVAWAVTETAMGIPRGHLLLTSSGDTMQTILKTLGSSSLVGLLFILPFMIMEGVNRQNLNEDFPFSLFFVLWLNMFAISLILLPVLRARWTGDYERANPAPAQRDTLLTNPGSAAMISVILFLSPGILPLLDSVGWLSVDRVFNGPNPEQPYLPGQILSAALILFPVAAGMIACGPIVNTLRAGGSLFAHPVNLIIVVVISFLLAAGLVGIIIDQWPCFVGVPNCD